MVPEGSELGVAAGQSAAPAPLSAPLGPGAGRREAGGCRLSPGEAFVSSMATRREQSLLSWSKVTFKTTGGYLEACD